MIFSNAKNDLYIRQIGTAQLSSGVLLQTPTGQAKGEQKPLSATLCTG